MTGAGLAPRPADEISALMKAAYGQETYSNSLMAGLNVVAQALNRGDLGRAMVAALRLKLPELTPEGAIRIAQAHDTLTKFDPSEPRDWRGRWTAEGESRAVNSTSPERRPGRTNRAPHTRESVTAPRSQVFHSRPANADAMRAIFISNYGSANDNSRPIPPDVICYALTRMCLGNARDPDYQSKMEDCASVLDRCTGMVEKSKESAAFQYSVFWPDGTLAIIRFGVIVPVRHGKPF